MLSQLSISKHKLSKLILLYYFYSRKFQTPSPKNVTRQLGYLYIICDIMIIWEYINLKPFRFYINFYYTAVIIIKRVSTFVNRFENPYVIIRIFDLIEKCRYAFYDYDNSKT